MSTWVYLRISRDRLGLELGIDRQRGDCLDLAQRRDWPDPVECVDNDLSASKGRHRPGYADLVAAIERGQVTRVIVWHPSRIWRNRAERAAGIELFKQHKIVLACVKGPELDLSTAYGRLAADLFGAFDSSESEVKAERVDAEVTQRAEQGRHHGGPRRYGYTVNGMELVPEEAADIARCYQQILAGRSLTALAHETGMPYPTLRVRLLNERYAGFRRLRGKEYPGNWPAIVPVDVFKAVEAILLNPGRRPKNHQTARRWMGSGLYQCERCGDGRTVGSSYTGTLAKGGRNLYKCKPLRGGCSRQWGAVPLDEFVEALVIERLGRGDLADLLPVDRPDLEALQTEAQGIRNRLRALGRDFVRLGLDENQVAEANRDGRARLAEIEAELGTTARGGVIGALLATEDPVKAWLDIPREQVDRRQAIIRSLFTITLGPPPRGRRWDPERFVIVSAPVGA